MPPFYPTENPHRSLVSVGMSLKVETDSGMTLLKMMTVPMDLGG